MNRRPLLIAPVLAAALLSASASAFAQVTAPAAPHGAAASAVIPVWREGDRTLGDAEAPVTLTVYLSTVCGHCAHWGTDDFPAFRARYVETGQVRVVFRDLFTAPVELAAAGARIARCAPETLYDEVLDALFRGHHAHLADETRPIAERVSDWLVAGGDAGGLTVEQMMACLDDAEGQAELSGRVTQSVADGVRGTPTFLLNGRMLSPAESAPQALDALIQPLLAAR